MSDSAGNVCTFTLTACAFTPGTIIHTAGQAGSAVWLRQRKYIPRCATLRQYAEDTVMLTVNVHAKDTDHLRGVPPNEQAATTVKHIITMNSMTRQEKMMNGPSVLTH